MTPDDEDDRWHCARCGAVTSMLGHHNGCPEEERPMTPERLAEQLACKHEYLSHDESHCERCGMGSSSIVAVQRTRIRDLEAQLAAARDALGKYGTHGLDEDGEGCAGYLGEDYPCICGFRVAATAPPSPEVGA